MGTSPSTAAIQQDEALDRRVTAAYRSAPKSGEPNRVTFDIRRQCYDIDPDDLADEMAEHTRYYAKQSHDPVKAARQDIERMDSKVEELRRYGVYGLYRRQVEAKRWQGQRTGFKLLKLLDGGPRTLQELAQALDMSQPGIRKRLRQLRDRGRVQYNWQLHAWERAVQSRTDPVPEPKAQGDPTTKAEDTTVSHDSMGSPGSQPVQIARSVLLARPSEPELAPVGSWWPSVVSGLALRGRRTTVLDGGQMQDQHSPGRGRARPSGTGFLSIGSTMAERGRDSPCHERWGPRD